MNIPPLQIHQQRARIAIDTRPPFMEIKQNRAKLRIKQRRGELKIQHRDVRVQIDNYPARHDLGLKNNQDFMHDSAARARRIALEVTARYARQGDRMADSTKPGNSVEEIAYENSIPERKELFLKWVRGPEFSVIPASLEINYTPYRAGIEVGIEPPVIRPHRGKVNVSMMQYAKVEIDWPGHLLDKWV